MGCCENRDEELEKESIKNSNLIIKRPFKTISIDKMSDQDLLVVNERAQKKNLIQSINNEESLRLYVEWCRSRRKWSEMVCFITDLTSITESNIFIESCSPPKTIAALIIVYLDLELKQEHILVVKAIEIVIFEVFLLLDKSNTDFFENAIFLLSDYAKYANDIIIRKLTHYNLFKSLFYLANINIEKNVLRICYFVIKGRNFLKQEFFKSGGLNLIRGITKELQKKNLATVEEMLNLIGVLMFKAESQLDTYSVNLLNDAKVYEMLSNGVGHMLPENLKEKLNFILENFKSHIQRFS